MWSHILCLTISYYEQSLKTMEECNYMDDIPYANIIGFVMYVMIYIRLNISYVVSVVNKFMSNLGQLNDKLLS